MKTTLFNLHDIALLLTAFECGLLALLVFRHRSINPLAHYLFVIFLILNALIALDALVFWGDEVRYRVFDISPHLFFLFNFAFFLEGPVLYWYTKSLVHRNFNFRRADTLHLLPAIAAPVYLYFVYYRYSEDMQRELVLDFQIFHVPGTYFNLFVTAQKIIVIIYGVMGLLQLAGYNVTLKNNFSNERRDFEWLQLLIGGFLLTWVWIFAAHLVGMHGMHIPGDASEMMGILGIYLILTLINILLFYSLLHPEILENFGAEAEQGMLTSTSLEHIAKIRSVMEAEKLFLNPRLTLDEFSEHVHLPPRMVSSAINRCLNQNFHEFVNRYRVEEAKRILSEPAYREKSVLDVAIMAGFNSKATFNRFFGNFAGLTPSQYRQKHLS